MPWSGNISLPHVPCGYLSVWPSIIFSSLCIIVGKKFIHALALKTEWSNRRRGVLTERLWTCVGDKGCQGFLNMFSFKGTLVISITRESSHRFFWHKSHSERHISQNTSAELKRCSCHSSEKKEGRRIAVYRVFPSATTTTVALCCMCELAPFTHC